MTYPATPDPDPEAVAYTQRRDLDLLLDDITPDVAGYALRRVFARLDPAGRQAMIQVLRDVVGEMT